jgi:hypothetical protein
MELDWSIQATLHAEGLIKLLLIFVKEAKKNLNRRFENPKVDASIVTELLSIISYAIILRSPFLPSQFLIISTLETTPPSRRSIK